VSPPPWILLHGAGGGAWEWRHWNRRLSAERRRFICPDFSIFAGGRQPTAFAQLSEGLSQSLQLEAGAALIGASFGGLLAASLVGSLQASALVLINPIACAPHLAAASAISLSARKHWGRDARLDATLRALPELDPVDAAAAFRHWADFDAKLLAEACAGIPLQAPGCPTLVLVCGEDRELSPAPALSMAHAWGADIVRLPGSHVSPLLGHRWRYAFDLVDDWLSARLR
jgi:pimeloyl-ACP methyl ester carboxylesterase